MKTLGDTTLSYYGLLSSVKFGDVLQEMHSVKIKNLFGVAREMLSGQIIEAMTRRISHNDFKYSLLFHFRIDESYGSNVYDYS